MLARASHAGRRAARFVSRIATPAKAASSSTVRNALPTMPFSSPMSTQTTQTRAAAIRAPIATQIDARRILFDSGEVIGWLISVPSAGRPEHPAGVAPILTRMAAAARGAA